MSLYAREEADGYVLCQEEEAEYMSVEYERSKVPIYFAQKCASELEGFKVITVLKPEYTRLVMIDVATYDDEIQSRFQDYVTHKWFHVSDSAKFEVAGICIADCSDITKLIRINPWQCITRNATELNICRRMNNNSKKINIIRYDDTIHSDTDFTALNYVSPYATVIASL